MRKGEQSICMFTKKELFCRVVSWDD